MVSLFPLTRSKHELITLKNNPNNLFVRFEDFMLNRVNQNKMKELRYHDIIF